MNSEKRRFIVTAFFVLALIVITRILSYLTGIDAGCYTKALTGFPCPGCGMTRAWLSAFSLDFSSAFYYHPLFLFPVLVAFLLFLKTVHHVKIPALLWTSLLVIFLGTYVIRLILFFPVQEPLDFNQNACLPRIFRNLNFIL